MRLIVACPRCRRQYDATAQGVGRRFRCHCGELLTVEAPKGHDAEVVRCSSCGGPRQAGATACGYCSADFTIHEQDIDTVCPGCLAMVSDKARFCHHCGLAIEPEQTAGEESPLKCPACENEHFLKSRSLGIEKVSALECQYCAGLWLGMAAFELLVERSMNHALPPGHPAMETRSSLPNLQAGQHWHYRPCPICSQLMPRQNYGRASGVIIDTCRGHGIWFDANELPRILDWVRLGGAQRVKAPRADTDWGNDRLRRLNDFELKETRPYGAETGTLAWKAIVGALGKWFGP